jgi:YebC/PmpR family DNA-binding regulatory protein
MAGHNKWSKVKRLKAVTDARKGKVFSRLSRDITLAAKAGGGDPDANARLRTLLLKARESNMPADNVDRAIKKGTGELPGVVYEDVTYEGYGPGGVAFVVKVTTDNKTRSAQDVRSIFAKHGGNLAASGAVAFQFLHAGQFLIAKDQVTEDRLMEIALDAGADDVITTDEGFEVRCEVTQGAARARRRRDQDRQLGTRLHPDQHCARERRRGHRDRAVARWTRGARRRAARLLQRGSELDSPGATAALPLRRSRAGRWETRSRSD